MPLGYEKVALEEEIKIFLDTNLLESNKQHQIQRAVMDVPQIHIDPRGFMIHKVKCSRYILNRKGDRT